MSDNLVYFPGVDPSAKGLEIPPGGGDSGGMDTLEKRVARLEILAENAEKRFDKLDAKLDALSGDVRALAVSVAEIKGTVNGLIIHVNSLPKTGDLFRLMLWAIGLTGAASALPQVIPIIAKLFGH